MILIINNPKLNEVFIVLVLVDHKLVKFNYIAIKISII